MSTSPNTAHKKRYGPLTHLAAAGIVDNETQLDRLMRDHGFPRPFQFGKRKRYWDLDEVDEWIASRRVAAE